MTNIQTNKQIAFAAAAAGWTGNDLQIAIAVANAESSRDADIVNGIGCVGLWQVNAPVWRNSYPSWTDAWLKIPSNNAQAAHKIWNVSGWGAWSTYTDGSYKKYMNGASTAIGNRVSSNGANQIVGSNLEIGPATGAQFNVSPIYLKNAPTMDDFYLMGAKLQADVRENVTSASVEFTTDQVSQASITIIDPKFDFLSTGLCKPGTAARLQNMNLVVATTSTDVASGNPTVTLKCRPSTVQALKNRRGPKVIASASPSDFVKEECKAVGAYAYIQASSERVSVSRDVPQTGQVYDLDQIPSSWTTFQRLASELGYICFEENGTIYFGQPTYFTIRGKSNPLEVGYKTGPEEHQALSIPQCSKSLDTIQTTISVNLPLSRAFEARCGRTMKLSGVPEFDGYYMISSVSFNLAGSTELMTVEAETPVDPVIQPPAGSNIVVGSLNQVGATSNGSWPLPAKYTVTTPYGVRGNWAAGFHTGSDFACPTGTPVYAVYDGTVVDLNTWGADYGNHIILKVGEAEWGFCHLSRIIVAKGALVKSGQVIGYSGATGNVTGPHLHLEYRTNPWKYNNKIADPTKFLMKKGVSSGVTGIGSGKAGSKLASDFVYFAQSRLGDKYVFGATRNPSNANQNTFDCVAEGTLLHTFDGARKIEDIKTGELVWSINPNNGHLELEPVISVFPKTKHKELVIEACGRRAVMSRKHHMAVVRKEPRTRNEKGQFNKNIWKMHQIDAQDVKIGDHVLIPTRLPDSGATTHFGSEEIDYDLGYFIGQFAGDGSYSNERVINIAAVKPDHRDKIIKIVTSRFPAVSIDQTNKYNLRFTSLQLRKDMEMLFPRDCKSYTKVIPSEIMMADHAVKEGFLDGYRDADGSYNSKTNSWALHSTSIDMINQARTMSIELGLHVGRISIHKRGNKPIVIKGKTVQHDRDIYSFTTWLNERNYGARIMDALGGNESFPGDYVRIVPVTDIYETENEVTMYDIEVNKNHTIMFDFVSYQCSSLVQWAAYQAGIHNFPGDTTTQSNYCAKKGTGINLDQAVHTRGALLYKIAGGGASDHVVISLGNGKTIEAMGTQYGVVNGDATGRGFNVAYLVPGLRYT